MKDFALDESGDIQIESGDIALVRDELQEVQKIRQVLGTKLGEWEYNANEGVDQDAFFSKQTDGNRIREAIQNALYEINADYVLQKCDYTLQNHSMHICIFVENQEPMDIYLAIKEE